MFSRVASQAPSAISQIAEPDAPKKTAAMMPRVHPVVAEDGQGGGQDRGDDGDRGGVPAERAVQPAGGYVRW